MTAPTLPTAAVIVASTSAAIDPALDLTGPIIRNWLTLRGFDTPPPIIVQDGIPVGEALRDALAFGHRVVLTTGGTGLSPDDHTPEMTSPFLDLTIPGLAEAVRQRGTATTPNAILSRGVAGFSGRTFVMNLPGSRGGVSDGLDVLDGVLTHLLEQRSGGHGHKPRTLDPKKQEPDES